MGCPGASFPRGPRGGVPYLSSWTCRTGDPSYPYQTHPWSGPWTWTGGWQSPRALAAPGGSAVGGNPPTLRREAAWRYRARRCHGDQHYHAHRASWARLRRRCSD
eukprot:16443585-Heterocapsa_arctica.AAC.1